MANRAITGTIYKHSGVVWSNAKLVWTLLTDTATRAGEALPVWSRTIYTESDGTIPAGFTLEVPATGSFLYRLKIESNTALDFYLSAGGGLTIDEVVFLAGQAGSDSGTPQAEWLIDIYAGVLTATDGQVLTADGAGGADWEDIPEVDAIPKVNPAVEGNLPKLLADGTLEDSGVGGDALIPKIDPAVAGDLVIQAADGTLVGAGMKAGAVTPDFDGAALGLDAAASNGGAVGSGAFADGGGAIGSFAETSGGAAVGAAAVSGDGGAVGAGARTDDGFAGGLNARTVDGLSPIDAVQLGTGTNSTAKTLQVYTYQLMGATGIIPQARLTAVTRPTQTDIAGTTHTFTTANENQIVASQSGSATTFTIPLNSAQAFPTGSIVGIERQGAGVLTIEATAGVTLNGVDGNSIAISVRWGAAAIRKIGTNAWVIVGAI